MRVCDVNCNNFVKRVVHSFGIGSFEFVLSKNIYTPCSDTFIFSEIIKNVSSRSNPLLSFLSCIRNVQLSNKIRVFLIVDADCYYHTYEKMLHLQERIEN